MLARSVFCLSANLDAHSYFAVERSYPSGMEMHTYTYVNLSVLMCLSFFHNDFVLELMPTVPAQFVHG